MKKPQRKCPNCSSTLSEANTTRLNWKCSNCQEVYSESFLNGFEFGCLRMAEKNRKIIIETMQEIEYWHADMLTPEERSHSRGSGWARIYDKLKNALENNGI